MPAWSAISGPGRTVIRPKSFNYIITSGLPTNFNRQWGATGNAVLHHVEGTTTRIEAETVTTIGVVEIVQGTTNHHPKIVMRGVTMQGVDGEAETEAEAGVVMKRIAEKTVKGA